MSKGILNVSLKGADDIFSTEESRQEQQREQVQQIPIGELFPFKNHPFKVLDDESIQEVSFSILFPKRLDIRKEAICQANVHTARVRFATAAMVAGNYV